MQPKESTRIILILSEVYKKCYKHTLNFIFDTETGFLFLNFVNSGLCLLSLNCDGQSFLSIFFLQSYLILLFGILQSNRTYIDKEKRFIIGIGSHHLLQEEAKKSHNLSSASQITRKGGDTIQSLFKDLKTKGADDVKFQSTKV